MNKKIIRTITITALILMLTMSSGCSKESEAEETSETSAISTAETEVETEEVRAELLSDEQALSAIENYCITNNPSLENIIEEGTYQTYWEVSSSDEVRIVVLFRSYTGAEVRYYIDRESGDTYVTEFVSGITTEEERTDENFNVRDYLV